MPFARRESKPQLAVAATIPGGFWKALAGIWCSLGVFCVAPGASAAAVSSHYNEPYPTAPSKKGLQVELVDDALALGVKHAALNFNLSQLIDLRGDTNNPAWEFEGRLHRF